MIQYTFDAVRHGWWAEWGWYAFLCGLVLLAWWLHHGAATDEYREFGCLVHAQYVPWIVALSLVACEGDLGYFLCDVAVILPVVLVPRWLRRCRDSRRARELERRARAMVLADPYALVGYERLAEALELQGRYDEALQVLRRWQARDPYQREVNRHLDRLVRKTRSWLWRWRASRPHLPEGAGAWCARQLYWVAGLLAAVSLAGAAAAAAPAAWPLLPPVAALFAAAVCALRDRALHRPLTVRA